MTDRKREIQRRTLNAGFSRVSDSGEGARDYALSFSSELPVERFFGMEILRHSEDSADFARLNTGGVLLFNHDRDKPIGSIVAGSARIEDKRGVATVRFFADDEGELWRGRVDRGELSNVSFAYRIHDYEERTANGVNEMTATRWEALEISLVTIPADNTVGFGRSDSPGQADPGKALSTKPAQAAENERIVVMPENIPAADIEAAKKAAATDAAAAERVRIASITELCESHNVSNLARDLIGSGATVDEARAKILDEMKRGGGQNPVVKPGGLGAVGMSKREQASYSLSRAILNYLSGNHTGLEFEISESIKANAARHGIPVGKGLCIATDLPLPYVDTRAAAIYMGEKGEAIAASLNETKRALEGERATDYAVGTANIGGNLVATQLRPDAFIDLLRNRLAIAQVGATMLNGLTGNVEIPRQTGSGTAYWVGEGAAVTPSGATFDKVALSPKTVGALSRVTRLMLLQSTPAIEGLIRADLLNTMALGIDFAALHGTGASGQPTGLFVNANTPVVAMGTNGGAITIDALIDMETNVATANADFGSLAYLTNPKVVGALKKLKATGGQYLWTNSAIGGRSITPGEINGYPVARTNQVRGDFTKGTGTNLSGVAYGNWSDLLIGMWGVLEITPSDSADTNAFAAGDIHIRALQTVDVAIRRPASFQIIKDAIA